MAIPVRNYSLKSQNSRVNNLAGNNDSIKYQVTGETSASSIAARRDVDSLIEQTYKQIFFHAMSCDRDIYLESQLRSGYITMRDFIRGLLLSERFQQGYYQCSSNYRMVEQVVGRVLGRSVSGEGERLAWSIVIAEKGFANFVDQILESDEYMSNFGYDGTPAQRGRLIPGRPSGDMPIYQRFPRYGEEWRNSLISREVVNKTFTTGGVKSEMNSIVGKPPAWLIKSWLVLFAIGGFEISRVIITIGISMVRN
ncbi:phycobilisome rod-core linker polypeptide [Synechococcus sp. CC9311]|jgi:phycobilisome rod-core linker protein|uniref:phycobilisome rod-core linker polypeptide n=1 Tax=Synechococcus sp. (strain CC9311) TaxID=64471 RepID=UPI0000DDAB08|nr:phycobilisome rod-core linker polypeptide [Synechococcus sp. CC9311]ABI47163.1 possible phycobilisome rod-core linker polypeptide (L-RC 28.5) [Synechococcus sp. CC9311]